MLNVVKQQCPTNLTASVLRYISCSYIGLCFALKMFLKLTGEQPKWRVSYFFYAQQANINLSPNSGFRFQVFILFYSFLLPILANCASQYFPNPYLKQKFLLTNVFGLKLMFAQTGLMPQKQKKKKKGFQKIFHNLIFNLLHHQLLL